MDAAYCENYATHAVQHGTLNGSLWRTDGLWQLSVRPVPA
jgi:hypothetical protein